MLPALQDVETVAARYLLDVAHQRVVKQLDVFPLPNRSEHFVHDLPAGRILVVKDAVARVTPFEGEVVIPLFIPVKVHSEGDEFVRRQMAFA